MAEENKPQEQAPQIKAKVRKKSLGEKLADTFLAEDISTTLTHVWSNVIVPKMKDIMSAAVDTALFGAPRRGPSVGDRGTNYNALSRPQNNVTSAMITRQTTEDIMLYSEQDVILLFNALQEQIRMSGFVTIGYLYRFLHMPSDHTKENWGWYQISERSYTKSFDENGTPVFCPILPKPIWLNR